jgi:hypothetical protein
VNFEYEDEESKDG